MISQNSQVNGQPRENLNADMKIVVEFQEIETRDRRLGDVSLKFFRSMLTRFPGVIESPHNMLGFTNDPKIGGLIEVGTRCNPGPPRRLQVCRGHDKNPPHREYRSAAVACLQ